MARDGIAAAYAPTDEADLETAILSYTHDPLGFVQFIYPWGEPGTLLEYESGPDTWQLETLDCIGQHLRSSDRSLRLAIASGHGIGKSALVSWIVHWFLSTKPHPQIKVTAGTGDQLEKHTWREVAKWHKLAYNAHWFQWTATKYYRVDHPETWFAAALPWSKDDSRAQSFAGQHETYSMTIYDEASTIMDTIWEVSDGAMSTPGAIWLAFGNPEKNTGRFKDAFPGGKFSSQWVTRQIDSRTAKKTDKREIAEQIALYGEDSDFVRVRWLGRFPHASSLQYIGEDLLTSSYARFREGVPDLALFPTVLGVDVARFGDDRTVFLLRRGPRITRKKIFRGLDTMQVASQVAEILTDEKPHIVFVDVVGIGAGVVDRLHQLGFRRQVVGVNAGTRASDAQRYADKRAEMWALTKAWLTDFACLDPTDAELPAELMGPYYGYDAGQRLRIERKEDMKKRGLLSPDEADALTLTFAFPVPLLEPPKSTDEDDEGALAYAGERAWMG